MNDHTPPPGEPPEPGYVAQVLALLRGPGAWANWVIVITQAAMFLAGVWAAVRFFAAGDVLTALKWGLPAAVLLLGALILKLSLVPVMQANRVLRALHRQEGRRQEERQQEERRQGAARGPRD